MSAMQEAWLTLVRAPGLSALKRRELFSHFGDVHSLLSLSDLQARQFGLRADTVGALRKPAIRTLAHDLAWLEQPGRSLITLDDPAYPQLLARLADAPVVLFVEGSAERLNLPCIAVVGSRGATAAGAAFAHALAAEFSRAGLTVVSGLALGIDAAAHAGGLAGPGSSAAVLATGLERIYPKQNEALAHQMLEEGGVLLSEMAPGTPALPALFPQRNRIISGLSLGVVVVEASVQSGSLITARLATEQGREVFAVPGSIHNPMARGCHHLIRQGAKLVESAQDVLEELKPLLRGEMAEIRERVLPRSRRTPRVQAALALPPVLSAEQQQVWDQLGFDPVSIDALVERTGWSIAALFNQLMEWEMDELIDAMPGARYQRRA